MLLALAGCSRRSPDVAAAAPPPVPAPPPTVVEKPVPTEGPSEEELFRFLQAAYQRIRDAGGMPVTVTANGASTVLQPRVYSLTKNECKPMVVGKPHAYECSVSAMVTLREHDRKPLPHGERIRVRWDPVQGVWQPQ